MYVCMYPFKMTTITYLYEDRGYGMLMYAKYVFVCKMQISLFFSSFMDHSVD